MVLILIKKISELKIEIPRMVKLKSFHKNGNAGKNAQSQFS